MIEFFWASQSFQWLVARSYEFTSDFLEPALKSNVLYTSYVLIMTALNALISFGVRFNSCLENVSLPSMRDIYW